MYMVYSWRTLIEWSGHTPLTLEDTAFLAVKHNSFHFHRRKLTNEHVLNSEQKLKWCKRTQTCKRELRSQRGLSLIVWHCRLDRIYRREGGGVLSEME